MPATAAEPAEIDVHLTTPGAITRDLWDPDQVSSGALRKAIYALIDDFEARIEHAASAINALIAQAAEDNRAEARPSEEVQ
jgi:hypothetical protein